jgi:channel protein (hemolysin III family)
LIVLSLSSVVLLSLSAVYHMLWPGIGRDIMHRIDIAGVFVLIAGTVTPIHMILFRGWWRWGPLAIVWGIAITGVTLRIVFFNRLPSSAGTLGFVILGWGGAFSTVVLWQRYGWSFVEPLVYGGIAYTIGALSLSVHWPVLVPGIVGPHELWHFAVLAGLGYHWFFVFQLASCSPSTMTTSE